MIRAAAAVVALVLAFAAAPVAAQTGKDAVAQELARTLLDTPAFDQLYREALSKGLAEEFGQKKGFPSEWQPLLLEAAQEEFAADKPALAPIIASEIATRMSEPELAGGLELVRNPAFQQVIAAQAGTGARSFQTSGRDATALMTVMRTPEGRSFAQSLSEIGALSEERQREVMRAVLPGTLRRFGEKAEAFEAARAR